MQKTPEKAALKKLLAERNQNPKRVAEIDAEIRRQFERRVAILALDMCGFSKATAKHGIIHYLAMIEQMVNAATPAITGNQGLVVKQEADNIFAVFDTPRNALEAALDIFRAFDAVNTVVPDERDIHGSIGIGFGDTLIIGGADLFGHEMNLASKLGEDLAKKSEILLTQNAAALLPKGIYDLTPLRLDAGGMEIEAFRVEPALGSA